MRMRLVAVVLGLVAALTGAAPAAAEPIPCAHELLRPWCG